MVIDIHIAVVNNGNTVYDPGMAKYTPTRYGKNRQENYSNLETGVCRQDFLKDIVKQLVERRKSLGMTQDNVDVRMGNADRLCSKWECGDRTPTVFNLKCWAETLKFELTLKTIEKH